MRKLVPAIVLLLMVSFMLASCKSKLPAAEETSQVEATAPAVETRVVVETRIVESTVVVTATPVPTPVYVSKISAPDGTLVYPLDSEPGTLDPQQTLDENAGLAVQQLYEGLFTMRADGSIDPAAATGYETSEDGLTYTVTLRTGMTWSDDEPLTAQQFVDGVCRILDPKVGNHYFYLLSDVVQITGAKEYATGESTDCATVGVRAPDEHTLTISLDKPAAFLPNILAFRTFLPIRKELVSAQPPDWDDPEMFVGNGPYLLSQWSRGKYLVLTKNSKYWDAEQVAINRVVLEIVPDPTDQYSQYRQGELLVASFPAEQTDQIQAEAVLSDELHVLVQPGTSYLALNTLAGPTSDLNVRRAIASAIDRQALIDTVLKQPWHVATQTLIPPGIIGTLEGPADAGYAYDPEAAKTFLAEAGYGPDNPPDPVDIWFNREGNNPVLFAAIGKMLEQVGIPVRLSSSDWDVYLSSLEACNAPNQPGAEQTPADCPYNAYRMGWVLDYADPASLLDVVFHPKSAFQYTGWQSSTYEELLTQARSEQDEEKRASLYQEAERILLTDEVAVVPLQFYDRTLLVKKGLTFEYPSIGSPNFRYWKLP